MSARVALLAMERDGLIALPPPRNGNGNANIARYHAPPDPQPPFTAPSTLEALGDIELVVVRPRPPPGAPERSLAYHYLGYTPFCGAQLRYLIESRSQTLGALGSQHPRGAVRHETPTSAETPRHERPAFISWSATLAF